MARTYKELIEELENFAQDIFCEDYWQRRPYLLFYFSVIVQALSDVHCGSAEHKGTALAYFNSWLYVVHCKLVGLDKNMLLTRLKQHVLTNREREQQQEDDLL